MNVTLVISVHIGLGVWLFAWLVLRGVALWDWRLLGFLGITT